MTLTVTRVDRHPIELPFREVPARHMARELPHWRYFDVIEVELEDGSVGFGETMLFYTWTEEPRRTGDELLGRNAAELMWQDALGPGLQIALFDAVGRSLGVPVHALLGEQVESETPVSWWCIDMPPEDWVAEAERAHAAGYTNLKVKGRPWFDIRAQLTALEEALPTSFSVDIDFNGTMLDADRALPLLTEFEEYVQVSHFEDPIGRTDVAGNRRLRNALSRPLVNHYGEIDPHTSLTEAVCDGFVLTDGASGLRNAAAVAAAGDRPCWLQLVGTGITAAFSLHCAAVCEAAQWPAVNCHQLYETDPLSDPIPVKNGMAPIPDRPGLGYGVDRKILDQYHTPVPATRPNPDRLIETDWTDGPTLYLAEGETNFMLDYARSGALPFFEKGVHTRLVPNDGSSEWADLHRDARTDPVWTDKPIV